MQRRFCGGQSWCPSLEIRTDIGQLCESSVLWPFLYSQLSKAASEVPGGAALSPVLPLPSLAPEMLEDVHI